MISLISSPFGILPFDWRYEKIKSHTDFLTGPAFDSTQFNIDANGYRLVRGINLTRGITRWDSVNTKFWEDSDGEYKKYELQNGDVVLGMDGSLVGKNYAQIRESDLPALLVQRVARLRTANSLDQRFLYYMFGNDSWISYVEIVKTNSGIPHISNGDIKDFRIPFPPLPEQQKIAAILTSVDDVIESTQAQINKLKDLKTGMMQ
jgi:type I restriction enzyme, S subunit